MCMDCGKDTWVSVKDYYMVKDCIWEKYAWDVGEGMLCVDCMEERIGHKLTKNELTLCLLNYDNPYTREIILR